MDESLKDVLEKFSRTIDEINEFKVAASKVLSKITEIGDISTRTTSACDRTVATLSEGEAVQKEVVSALSAFLQKTEAAVAYEHELGDSIALLNRNFQGVINLSKQLSDGLSSIRQSETATTKAILDLEQKLAIRLTRLEDLIGNVAKSVGGTQSDIVGTQEELGSVCAKCGGKKEYADKPLCLKCWKEGELQTDSSGQTDRPWKTNKGGK